MRILVTGSREWQDEWELQKALLKAAACAGHNEPIIIVHGNCPTGADWMADKVAVHYEWGIDRHPAMWAMYGKAAGHIRNQEMVDAGADICLAFFQPGAANRGTQDCMSRALKAGIPVTRYPQGGDREPSGAGPDSPPASESRLPGGSDDYHTSGIEAHPLPGPYREVYLSPAMVSFDLVHWTPVPAGTSVEKFVAGMVETPA